MRLEGAASDVQVPELDGLVTGLEQYLAKIFHRIDGETVPDGQDVDRAFLPGTFLVDGQGLGKSFLRVGKRYRGRTLLCAAVRIDDEVIFLRNIRPGPVFPDPGGP